MSRDIRRLINSVEHPQTFSDGSPASSLQEGGTIVSLDNGTLAVRRKHKGIVFKSTMSSDGNKVIDRKLTTSELEYKRKFVDYRTFNHNFPADLPAAKRYMPWKEDAISTSDVPNTAYLTPFKMICEKLLIKLNASDNTVDITFGVERVDDGDATSDVVANGLASLTIQAASTDLTDGDDYNFYVTSVWKTFIEI